MDLKEAVMMVCGLVRHVPLVLDENTKLRGALETIQREMFSEQPAATAEAEPKKRSRKKALPTKQGD